MRTGAKGALAGGAMESRFCGDIDMRIARDGCCFPITTVMEMYYRERVPGAGGEITQDAYAELLAKGEA